MAVRIEVTFKISSFPSKRMAGFDPIAFVDVIG